MEENIYKVGDKVRMTHDNLKTYGINIEDVGTIKYIQIIGVDYAVEFEDASTGSSCDGHCKSNKGVWLGSSYFKPAGVYWTVEVTSKTNGRTGNGLNGISRTPFVLRQM